jgi:transcriptional regulator with XRE-family HTH domain
MPTEKLANYLNEKRVQAGLTFEAVATISNRPESTVKNLCTGKTEDPRLETVIPVMKAVGGSFDEMLFPEKTKDEVKEASMLALKDIYEYQLSVVKETNEAHIHNIRSHYEQHHEDLKENYERRLADKRDLIHSYKEHIGTLEKEYRNSKIALWICVVVFITFLIAELMNPNLGWFRY